VSAKLIEGVFPATAMPDSEWWGTLWPEPARVLEKLGIRAGLDVIDLCCGDGLFTEALARMSRRVAAIDIDPRMLNLAQARVAAAGAGNCAFIEGDAYEVTKLVPWPADVVLIANTFHGVPDKTRLATAVAAVLRPRGQFIVINWHRLPREETVVLGEPRGPRTEMRMTPEDVAAAVEATSLKLSRLVDLPPYHYGAVFEKRGL